MNKSIFIKLRSVIPAVRSVSGIGAVAILAVLVAMAIGSAQAAGIEQNQTIHSGDGGNSGILLAANDAHAAGEAKKDAKASDAKTAAEKKDTKAAPAPKKSYGPIGSIFNYLGSNLFVFLFLSLAIGYPLGKVAVKGVNLRATAGTLIWVSRYR